MMKLIILLSLFTAYCAQASCTVDEYDLKPTKNWSMRTQMICYGFSHDDLKKVEVFETDLTAQYVVVETDCKGNNFYHPVVNGDYMPSNEIKLFDYRGNNEMYYGERTIAKKVMSTGEEQYKIEYYSYGESTLFQAEPIHCISGFSYK